MSFVQERERRSNAGNRMRALLDREVDMEELFEETESEDEEFEQDDDEEPDTVDPDFDINSSEGEQDQEDQGRQEDFQIARAEKQARRQQTALPAAAVTAAKVPTRTRKPQTTPRVPREKKTSVDRKRQSFRTNTVLNRLQVEEQIKESKLKRSLLPKRDRPTTQRLTQEEMLAEAALTEEENKASLAQWHLMEAERRARAKKKGARVITAPLIRFHSFVDGELEERPKRRKLVMIADNDGENVQSEITDREAVEWQTQCDLDKSETVGRNLITFVDDQNTDVAIKTTGFNDRELDRIDLIPALTPWLQKEPRPAKPIICPISGLQARYREPTTMVPYANKEAYKVIQTCIDHTMVWSASLGVYVGGSRGAAGVPEGWDRMMQGKQQGQNDWARQDGSVQYPKWLAAKKTPPRKVPVVTPSPSTITSKRRARHRSHNSGSPPTAG